MLIVLMFLAEGLLAQPLLYLSLHFKRHREVCYELLQAIRTKGAWEDWLEFFVGGVTAVADDAVRKMQELYRCSLAIVRGSAAHGRAGRPFSKPH